MVEKQAAPSAYDESIIKKALDIADKATKAE